MKQPPQKPLNAREIRGFFLRLFVMLLLTGGIFWFGWKSRWARADTQVTIEAPDAPHPVPATPPVVPVTPTTQSVPENPAGDGDAVQRSESVDRQPDEPTEELSTKPRRRHRAHKPPADESSKTEDNKQD